MRAKDVRRVIVVNETFRAAPWADVLYANDADWWEVRLRDARRDFGGELWTSSEEIRELYGLNWVGLDAGAALSGGPGILGDGRNSGHHAIALAYQFGAARVVLLGYDMQRTGGRSHWHGDHQHGLGNLERLAEWPIRMEALAEAAEEVGFDIVNASASTALRCFHIMPLTAALAGEMRA